MFRRLLLGLTVWVLLCTVTNAQPAMVPVTAGGQPGGPDYTFNYSQYLITNSEWVRFLNDAEAFRGLPTRSLAALVSTAVHGDPRRTFDVRIPLEP